MKASMPLLAYLEKYASEGNGLTESTMKGRKFMRRKVEEYLRSTGRLNIAMLEVDLDFCRGFINFLRTAKNRRLKSEERTISNCTGLQTQAVFTAALNTALRDGIIERNPMTLLTSKERFHQQESTRVYLTIDELKRMMATPCDDGELKKAFLFACFTGLRLSDIRTFTWNKVLTTPNDSTRYIRVRMLKTQQVVNVPLSKDALGYLRETEDGDEPIFRLSSAASVIEQRLAEWAKNAGIEKHVTFHVSRHSYATMMLTIGVDIYTVSKLLGHKNVATTTGLDAAAIIHEALPETHIVFLTAFDRFDYAVGAMRAGGADYLLKPFDSAQINACLQKLGLLTEKQEHREERSENPFCAQFSVWLANHYMQDISLEEAAEAMGMSSFYFSRFFRTAYNRTFLEYLTAYRIERAEELLRQTDIPVREIAPRVGYTDANYFTKVFKRHCGCTPTDYRSRL